jgi:pimeloyl-ACP methyl ester carboxylesterase
VQRKIIESLFALSVLALLPCGAWAKTEFGTLQGAQFRIDLPENWNHGLVVYYHGYRTENHGRIFDQTKPLDETLAVFTKAGFAVIQSGYSRGGMALEQAIPETDALRKYFVEHYGNPSVAYVAGHSMGGDLVIMTMEQAPGLYAGALDLCGAVTDTLSRIGRRFDLRVLYDYYFPNILPDPAHIPASYESSDDLQKKVAASLETNPAAAAVLRAFMGLHNDKDLASLLLFATWVLKDLEERAGGNPFDNRNTIYAGMTDDNAVNEHVKRYPADPGALNYIQRYYTPTGHLTKPVLAIHTTYDPLVPPSVPSTYAQLTRMAGNGDLFVLQYVEHDGHCNITPEEVDKAFAELREWKEKGTAPQPGHLH